MDKQGTTFEMLLTKCPSDEDKVTLGYRWSTPNGKRRREISMCYIDELADMVGHDLAVELQNLEPGESFSVVLELHSTGVVKA